LRLGLSVKKPAQEKKQAQCRQNVTAEKWSIHSYRRGRESCYEPANGADLRQGATYPIISAIESQ
jgi:hypothetical protein